MSREMPKAVRAVGRAAGSVVDALAAAERVLAAGLLALVLVTAAGQVFMRYVMNEPLASSDEVARFGLVWLAFIAAALTQNRDQHIAVLVLRTRGGRRSRQILDGLANLAALITAVAIVVVGFESLDRGSGVSSPSLEIPMTVVYLAVVLGFALVAIHSVRNLVNLFRYGKVAPDMGDNALTEAQMS